jgi:CARDB
MSSMRALVLTFVLLLVPASVAGATGSATKHSKVALTVCDTELNTATFRGTIGAFGKAKTLQLRFTLQARVVGGGGWKRVVAPSFDTWLTSTPGKKGFVFDKAVQNLAAGADYRAVVRFRWKDAKGREVAHALKSSPACQQPDDRPNLKVAKVSVRQGTSPQTRTYVVKVANRGGHEAPAFSTGLTVNAKPLADQASTGPLAAGAATTFSFTAPKCIAGSTLTAEADTTAVVDEADETDNVLAVPCPTGTRNGGRLSLD